MADCASTRGQRGIEWIWASASCNYFAGIKSAHLHRVLALLQEQLPGARSQAGSETSSPCHVYCLRVAVQLVPVQITPVQQMFAHACTSTHVVALLLTVLADLPACARSQPTARRDRGFLIVCAEQPTACLAAGDACHGSSTRHGPGAGQP